MSDELHDPRPMDQGIGPLWHEDAVKIACQKRDEFVRAVNSGDPDRIKTARAVLGEWWVPGEYR